MKREGLSKLGWILSFTGAINIEHQSMRVLHPVTWIIYPLMLIPVIIMCIFTEFSIIEYHQDNYCLW